MMGKRVASLLVASCLLLGAGVTVASAESAGAGFLPPCPTASSNTILFGSCVGTLEIVADNVSVNLNGFTVDCPGDGDGVVVDASNVVVRNGTVRNCNYGVYVTGDNNRVASMKLAKNGYGILVIDGDHNRFVGNRVSSNQLGIQVNDDDNAVLFNVSVRNEFGISVNAHDNLISANIAILNSEFDMYDFDAGCDNNVWRYNFFFTAGAPCIH
jgi:parallel beta-helix repeat protein